MKPYPFSGPFSGTLTFVDVRDRERLREQDELIEYQHEERGLGAWLNRNRWLLLRLFIVIVLTFGATMIAEQFAYGREGGPKELSVDQVNNGQLPAGVQLGDYVRITGTPDVGENITIETLGTEESRIGVAQRYLVSYFYVRLEETGDNLLVQTVEQLPDFRGGEKVWEGKLSNVGTVIFQDTTVESLQWANFPTDAGVLVVETGDTPETYNNLFPAYTSVLVVWALSLFWLVWKRNKPFI